jgi:hypothetical protein
MPTITEDEARHVRTLERVRALTPVVQQLLAKGHTRSEVARTLRTQSDIVLGQAEAVARMLRHAADELDPTTPATPSTAG